MQYAALRGDSLVLLDVEALGTGGCVAVEGDELAPDELSAFVPVLDAVVQTTLFPEAQAPPPLARRAWGAVAAASTDATEGTDGAPLSPRVLPPDTRRVEEREDA